MCESSERTPDRQLGVFSGVKVGITSDSSREADKRLRRRPR